MADVKNPYLLPLRKAPGPEDERVRPKHFRGLVEILPMGDVAQLSKQVHHLLLQLNRLEIPVSDRMRNLEMLLQPVLFVMNSLSKGYVREMLPLGRRATVMAETRERIGILAVQGYKVVLDQFHRESLAGHMLHKSNRALALHRVLYFLGQNLLQAFQLYRPSPRYLWSEIHGIYRYAVDQKLADRALDHEDPDLESKVSCTDLYKQILLLSLAGPYRLMQGEASSVYKALVHWVGKAGLIDLGKSNGEAGPFIVDISVDEPPRMKGANRDREVSRGWVLDTRELAVYLANELEQMEAPHGAMRPREAPDRIAPDLMARLMLAWGIGTHRTTERDASPGEVAMVCGLDAIYAAAGGEPPPRAEVDPRSFTKTESNPRNMKPQGVPKALLEQDEFVVHDDPELARIRESIERSIDPNAKSLFLDGEVETPAEEQALSQEPRMVPLCSCPVFNESSSGYQLGWTGSDEQQISVGELVAVVRKDRVQSDLIRLGVIRWMRSVRPDLIDFGVELFGGDIKPVLFSRQWGRPRQTGVWPGLLMQRPGEDPTLITSPFYTEPEIKTWLIEEGQRREVVLSREIEVTASFIQFYCWDPERGEETAYSETLTDEDLDQLWSHL